MQKEGRRAGAGECGRNLAADQAGFAHSGYGHTSFASDENVNGFREAAIEAGLYLLNCAGFDFQDPSGGFEAHGADLLPVLVFTQAEACWDALKRPPTTSCRARRCREVTICSTFGLVMTIPSAAAAGLLIAGAAGRSRHRKALPADFRASRGRCRLR